MPATRKPPLRRERYPMPADIRSVLTARALMSAYKSQPPYQPPRRTFANIATRSIVSAS